jgi:DNA-3-methyladenine glycosylase I
VTLVTLVLAPDGKPRCAWGARTPDYLAYHDREWGFPVADDRRLFEKICLEGFQSGLSWLTILRKREAFRAGFAGFDIDKVARFGTRQIDRLLADAGIVRHRGKIESTINNARRARELVKEYGSLAAYVWGFEPTARPYEPAAVVLAKDLKKRGWTFVGPTTVYAFMQAMGLIDDHAEGCATRAAAEQARKTFRRPSSRGSQRGVISKRTSDDLVPNKSV